MNRTSFSYPTSKVPGRPQRRFLVLALPALVLASLLLACKTTSEATSAASRLTTTSQQLSDYYTDLSTQVDDTVALNQMQFAMLGVPFDDADRTRLNTTKTELGKRAAMAKALGALASAYSALAGSKSGTDIGNAASDLAKACAVAKALPGGPAIPDVVSQAGQQLVELVRAHKLQESSEAISRTVGAVEALFEAEEPVYESIHRQRITLAQSLAVMLVQKDMVDTSSILAPALKPFDLTPKLSTAQTPAEFRQYAEARIQSSANNQNSAYQKSTEALADSLKSTRKQVEEVAKKH
jgi:hypothetical protein